VRAGWPERIAAPLRPFGAFATLVLLHCALVASPAAAVPPEEDYALQCMGCHRPDGSGLSEQVPTLHGLDRFLALPGGRAYLVQVPGVAQSSLSDARLSALLNWLLREFGDDLAPTAPPFSPAEVARLRSTPLANPSQTRRELLE
jgi:hypothetical protein